MSTIASKNLFDLLGNDPEQDPDREPAPPTKVADRPVARAGKRNAAEGQAGGAARGGAAAAGGRGGRPARDDAPVNNRASQRDNGPREDRRPREPREGGYRGRGTRGGARGGGGHTFRAGRDDRQSHTGIGEHDKQAAHGWGDTADGNAEWTDEKAGEAIAQAEVRNEAGFTPDTNAADPAFSNGPDGEVGDEAFAEAEDKTKSYDEYLAEQAEKRLALGGGGLQARKANEGSKQKFPEGSALSRNPEEENFFVGGGGKARREKQQKAKELLTIDGNYYAAPDSGERGGRGRGRGGRGGGRGEFRGDRGGERGGFRSERGEFRGDRGDRGGRGGRGRGEFRGARGEFRGGERGGRGGPRGGAGLNTDDQRAFPALGGA